MFDCRNELIKDFYEPNSKAYRVNFCAGRTCSGGIENAVVSGDKFTNSTNCETLSLDAVGVASMQGR